MTIGNIIAKACKWSVSFFSKKTGMETKNECGQSNWKFPTLLFALFVALVVRQRKFSDFWKLNKLLIPNKCDCNGNVIVFSTETSEESAQIAIWKKRNKPTNKQLVQHFNAFVFARYKKCIWNDWLHVRKIKKLKASVKLMDWPQQTITHNWRIFISVLVALISITF